MVQQYLRTCRATINGVTVQGGGNEDLRVRFDTHQALSGTPHHVNIYITNPAPSTIATMRKEKAAVSLYAGYQGNQGLIFEGQILQVRNGRENVTDTYVHVLATSSENGRNYATVNKSLAAGHTFKDRINEAAEAMKVYGVTLGFVDDLGSRKFSRNFVFSGMAHDLLREVCESVGATWHIQGNKLNIVKADNTIPGSTIVLNSNTGLIGLPEQTLRGVVARCLLNPNIYPGSKVQINEASVQQATFSPVNADQKTNELYKQGGILGIAADGIYKVWEVAHFGDTRGQEWYTEISCTTGEKSPFANTLMLPDDIPSDGAGDSDSPGASTLPDSSIKGPR